MAYLCSTLQAANAPANNSPGKFLLQAMFAAQLVGMFAGCFLAPATFQMFVAGQPDLGQPGSTYPAPFAQVYRNMAVVGVGGASELGLYCLWVCTSTPAASVRVFGQSCCALLAP